MTRRSTLGGNRTPKSIVNGGSVGAIALISIGGSSSASCKTLSGGVTVASELKTALALTGGGELNHIALQSGDATPRTLRLKITLDGVVVFDASAAAFSAGQGLRAIGYSNTFGVNQSIPQEAFEQVCFASTALVEFSSSLAETDKVSLAVAYKVY